MGSNLHHVLILAFILLAASPVVLAQAPPCLDQAFLPTMPNNGLEITSTQPVTQTFTAGITGNLTAVEISLIRHHRATPTLPLVVDIVTTDGTGAPTNTSLGTISVPATAVSPGAAAPLLIDLSNLPVPIAVQAGQAYGLALSYAGPGGGATYAWEGVAPSTGYPGGQVFLPFGGLAWDLAFQTFVGTCPGNWHANTPDASLDMNGVILASPFGPTPAITSLAFNQAGRLTVSSGLIGQIHNIAVTLNPLVTGMGGGLATASGQVVNLGIADPTLAFVYGGAGVVFNGDYTTSFNTPAIPGFVASAQMVILNPAAPDGFSLSQGVEFRFVPCNAQEDFDGLAPGQVPVGWANSSVAGTMPWTVNSGGTPSGGTGPTASVSGANYLYTETSGPGIGATFAVDTCVVDTNTLANFTLTFDLSRIGADIGTLNILVDDGVTGFVNVPGGTFTGADPTQSQGGLEWSAESIDLSSFAGSSIRVRLEYTGGASFRGDLAIDNLFFN